MSKYPLSVVSILHSAQRKINFEISKRIQWLYRQKQYKRDCYGFTSEWRFL